MHESIELTISDVGYGGKGVARHEGYVCFVPGTLIGEKILARVTRRRKRFAEAELVEVLEASEHRVSPACPLVADCPGCSYQHCSYDEELAMKQAQLGSLLERLARIPVACVKPAVGSPRVLNYRNKLRMHAGMSGEQAVLGYVGRDNVSILDVPNCPLAKDALNEELSVIRKAREEASPDSEQITLRYTDGDGVRVWGGNRPTDKTRVIEQTVLGPLQVPPDAFFQVNPEVANLVLEYVMALITASLPGRLVDLYCGVGVFALAASKLGVEHVVGVDSDRKAVKAAYDNGMRLDLDGLEFIHGDVLSTLDEVLSGCDAKRLMVLLDPPRRGVDGKVLDALLRYGPKSILYVSCAADTLARDLRKLTESDYQLESAQLFDMFPRTALFETVAYLKKT